MVNVPLFSRFYTSQVVSRISSVKSIFWKKNGDIFSYFQKSQHKTPAISKFFWRKLKSSTELRPKIYCFQNQAVAPVDDWIIQWFSFGGYQIWCLHPGRLTAGTYKSPIWKGKWSSKPPWLCSMLIFRGVSHLMLKCMVLIGTVKF